MHDTSPIIRQFEIKKKVVKAYPYKNKVHGDGVRYSVGLYDGHTWAWKNDYFGSEPIGLREGETVWLRLFNSERFEKKFIEFNIPHPYDLPLEAQPDPKQAKKINGAVNAWDSYISPKD